MISEKLTMTANGKSFEGFETVTVRASLKEACRAFEIDCSEVPSATGEQPWHFPPGTSISISANGALLLTGFVDDYEPVGDDRQSIARISGRTKGADFVDCSCSHKTGQFENMTVEQIASELDESDVGIESDVETGGPVPWFRTRQGATRHEEILRLARQRKLVLKGKADGGILITKAANKRHAGGLIYPGNVKSWSAKLSQKERFSDYVVKGQSSDAWDDGQLAPKGTATDSTVKRKRTKVIVDAAETDNTRARNRAQWEKQRAAGRSTTASVTTPGFRDQAGTIFEPGWLIYYRNPRSHIDQYMLIETVEFRQSLRTGSIATLELVDPKAYDGQNAGTVESDQIWSQG